MGNDIMNQMAILLIICGVVISGCSEAVDSTYRESSETRNVPTLHLVVDSERSRQYRISRGRVRRDVSLECHVQSNRPVDHDTYVLVNVVLRWGGFSLDDVRRPSRFTELPPNIEHGFGYSVPSPDLAKWSMFAVILAGETQSQKLGYGSLKTYASRQAASDYPSLPRIDEQNPLPLVVVTLPPAHERAKVLPQRISYTDTTGQVVEKDLLVEYPFNPYNIGSPAEIRVEWREGK